MRSSRRPSPLRAGAFCCLLLASFAASASAAGDENGFALRSKHLRFQYYDKVPDPIVIDSTTYVPDTVRIAAMWDGLARALTMALQIQGRIEHDKRLDALLSAKPVSYTYHPRGGIQPAPPDDMAPDWGHSAALLSEFTKLVPDSPATLYAVRLDAKSKARGVDTTAVWYEDLRRERLAHQRVDPTVSLDWWRFGDAGDFERPTLYALPFGPKGEIWVMSGLFYSNADAKRWAERLRTDYGLSGAIVPVKVTGDVLRRAFPPI
ncbi:MAG TPA: hypothetical protein VFP58_08855 [Candidatus Eisenbacteria bacterium]|nr:hypothetical protein [Candidatus Eisenbacteria bacterium]